MDARVTSGRYFRREPSQPRPWHENICPPSGLETPRGLRSVFPHTSAPLACASRATVGNPLGAF